MHPRFHAAFAMLPLPLQTALEPMLSEVDFQAFLTPQQVTEVKNATGLGDRQLAFALLPLAASCAVTPLSNFKVGALARGKSGHLFFGANMEFVTAPLQQTLHAEQSAITHAWLRGETALEAITVNYTPCGHCRQFMNELNSGTALNINLPQRAPATLADYLPDAFGPRDLQITTLLLDDMDHQLSVKGEPLAQAALQAANRSHAPYTGAWSGVALQAADGTIFTGSYAENAAFNPTIAPLQTALNLMNLSGHDILTVQRAILAEAPDAKVSQHQSTTETLQALGCANISIIPLA